MSTLRTISGFKSAMAGGGARPNLFEVSIDNFPAAVADLWSNEVRKDFRFMCKAANIPASNIASIDVPFRGRIFKVAGDRTIDNWNITVINDENFTIRTAFEAWHNLIAKLDNNSGATNPSAYMVNAFVYQLGRGYSQGLESDSNSDTANNTKVEPLRTYKFVDIFPTAVSDIALSYDSGDTIEEFTVEFAVQNIEIGGDDQNGTSIV
jgi:hypothetical protein